MFSSKFLKKALAILLLEASLHTQIYAAPITWIAQSSNDLNLPSNWNPATVPTTGDDAIFDSTIPGIITNPVGQGVDFSCSNFQFLVDAFPFDIIIQNRQLIFDGFGIIGTNTDATVHSNNTDTPYVVNNQIFFNGSLSTSGSATLAANNDSTIFGSPPATSSSIIDRQIYSPNAFTVSSSADITASNSGTDFSVGAGGDIAAGVYQGQAIFGDTCSLDDFVRMQILNNGGSFSPKTNNFVGYVREWQLHSVNDFVAGDGFFLFVANAGRDFSTGVGGQNTAIIDSLSGTTGLQIDIGGELRIGEFANILVLNSGFVVGSATTDPLVSGTMANEQVRIHGAFESDDFLNMNVFNQGIDSSNNAGGNRVGVVPAAQLRCDSRVETGENSTINVDNFGSNIGTSNGTINIVGGVSEEQIVVNGAFQAEDFFTLSVTCEGTDSTQSPGGNYVGMVGTTQAKFNDTLTVGNQGIFFIENQGSNTGNTTVSGNRVGTVQNTQFDVEGEFQAGDSLNFSVTNTGSDSSTGVGDNFTGAVLDPAAVASQVLFNNNVTIGKQALMTVSNFGTCTGTTSSLGNMVGFLNQDQFHVSGDFIAGDDFDLDVSNEGLNSCVSAGVDIVGTVISGLQVCFSQACTLGDHAKITVSNKGTYTGNSSVSTSTGYIFDNQACFEGQLTAGKNFNLALSNEGIADTIGNDNFIGVSTTQLDLDQGCVLGEDAVILITNKGTNSNPTGINNLVGYVNGNQATINGFSAGKNLELSVVNSASNTGNATNSVGYVVGSQINFLDTVDLNDNSLIFASNSGTVAGSQMVFQNGFNILSGKATLHALNSGTVGSKGIYVLDGAGGNANIVLNNSSFYVDTALASFTIGELNGDATSIAQSRPELIIKTDSSTNGDFAGSIQDFPATVSTLTKTGVGSQKLSGVNTYTGLTKVDAGTLILNGSVAGDVTVNLFGTLKGIGTIGGSLVNFGTVAPGESIGTLTVLADYVNNSGTYKVEVNGQGQSTLMDVSGNVMLSGGNVPVSSVDGGYRFHEPYTIVVADGIVSGAYTGATSLDFINPILTYDLHHVYLTIESALLKAARSCNQIGVATNLDSLRNMNGAQFLLISALVNLPGEQTRMALESFSGFQYTQDVWMTEIATRGLIRRLYDPLRSLVSSCHCCVPCSEWTTWLETGGGFTHKRGRTAHKMKVDSYELTGGVQKTFCNDITFGLAGSYEHDHVKYRNGNANRNSEFIAAYGLYRPCLFYGLADLVYGHTSSHCRRTMHAGNLGFKAHGKPNLNMFAFYGEMGFDVHNECALIQPFLGVQAGKNWRKRIHENRADGWGLSINKRDWTSVSSRLGLHFSQCNFCEYIDATLDIAWNHLWAGHKNSTRGRFSQFGEDFRICGNDLDRDSFDYAFTFQTCPCDNLNAYIELGGELWSRAHTIDVIAGVKFSW